MKFSLKTYLITLCVVGAVTGVMGKLYIEQPEQFLNVLGLASTVGPFALAVGTIIWLGFRGLEGRRHPRLIMWGLFLLLFPGAARVLLVALLPSGDPLRMLSTQRLIEKRLPARVEEPWVWNELKYRLEKGKLSKEEVDEAIGELTSHMKKTRPAGWNQPLSWQNEFIAAALKAKMMSDTVFLELCDAFYGQQPAVRNISPVREGQANFQLNVEYGNPWSKNSGLGIEMLWTVKRVLLDGKPMKVHDVNHPGWMWLGFCDGDFKPGKHEVQVEVECAYVDENLTGGMTGGEIPLNRWPPAKKRWTTTVTVPLTVQPKK